MLEQEALKTRHHQELLHSSIVVQEAERKRIAQDLHDEIGGLLMASRMYFNQLGPGHSEEQLRQISEKVNGIFDEMMINIRRISHDLRPVILENLGLVEAIECLHEKLAEGGIDFNFTHRLTYHLNKEVELNLYRIIQELIGNTLKHARATHIFLDIKADDHSLSLNYGDNGIGFIPEKSSAGLGMKSIASRLTLLQGSMKVTKQDKGVLFSIHLETPQLYKP